MESESNLSEEVYLLLQTVIGTPAEVDIRRKTRDIEEAIYNSSSSTVKLSTTRRPTFLRMLTGSQREGFQFDDSDVDFMYWWTDHKVISHSKQENLYNKETMIMMEYCDGIPGSVLLKVKKWSECGVVKDSYVKLEKGTYMSSSKYRESTKNLVVKNSHEHGPCASGQLGNGFYYDNVHSMKYDFLLPVASSWIKRCETKGWPDYTVLQYARKTGCHFVPIGRKNSPNQDHEWRISFNLIELKCVHSMNHVQFTCYGLLKIFLNKVIKPLLDDKDLLSSYFLKTIMFYIIQEKEKSFWVPENLMNCFWNCFEFLILCVYRGNLPNFFIQENNMFQDKIAGSSREKLLVKLLWLYSRGNTCILPCISEKQKIKTLVLRRYRLDFKLFYEIYSNVGFYSEFAKYPYLEKYMFTINRLMKKETTMMTFVEIIAVRQQFCTLITHLTFLVLHDGKTSDVCKAGDLLKVATKHGFLSNNVFYVMYLYRLSRFEEALGFAKKTKKDLEQPHVSYLPCDIKKTEFITYGKDNQLSTKLREAVAVDISLSSTISYLEELGIEQYETLLDNECFHIPPYVLTLFLIILCNIRLEDTKNRDITLCELKDLLNNDVGRYVHISLKNNSWHILGIAQQLSGCYTQAIESYRTSLTHWDRSKISRAKIIRMLTVVSDKKNKNA